MSPARPEQAGGGKGGRKSKVESQKWEESEENGAMDRRSKTWESGGERNRGDGRRKRGGISIVGPGSYDTVARNVPNVNY